MENGFFKKMNVHVHFCISFFAIKAVESGLNRLVQSLKSIQNLYVSYINLYTPCETLDKEDIKKGTKETSED